LVINLRLKRRRGKDDSGDAVVAALCEAPQKEGTSLAQNLAATSRPVRAKSGNKLGLPEKGDGALAYSSAKDLVAHSGGVIGEEPPTTQPLLSRT
jgi:hypothetical protein